MRQFDGVFGNRSLDPKTGVTNSLSANLFEFLTHRSSRGGGRGTEVEIRSSGGGSTLDISLFDQIHEKLDAAELRLGTDFEIEEGGLNFLGASFGSHTEASNLAGYWETRSARLFLAPTGDLLGRLRERSAGLFFYLIPFVGSAAEWSLWPKLAP